METILKINNLQKYYGRHNNLTKAIDNISFEVSNGEFIGVMGPSGSGKTTLLNTISTIDQATAGNIYIDGVDITTMKPKNLAKFRREKLGFVFQDFNLLDTMTAYENIALALTIIHTPANEVDGLIKQAAKTLNIMDVLYKYPYQMSGGQKQRVAAARAIVTKPSLILADEPTGALDSRSAQMLLENFSYLNQATATTIMMVTHDAFAASYCKRILFLRDGKIFNELIKGTNESRKQFFDRIVEVIALLGGELDAD
ncbi:MAG: ABC transporter ATP-binding protein [Erysipelotrichaceae bacterium]|nr:ABC transporter ATP-binding protein [Erysipelotrichaceae bacterium]MDY5252860.1 ABC transporter ATP-binding protein [Erysipelotrichaceae bacterium]